MSIQKIKKLIRCQKYTIFPNKFYLECFWHSWEKTRVRLTPLET